MMTADHLTAAEEEAHHPDVSLFLGGPADDETRTFLRALYQGAGPGGYVGVVGGPVGKARWVPAVWRSVPAELDALAADAVGRRWNAYVNVNPMRAGVPKGKRGALEYVAALVGYVADLDLDVPGHKGNKVRPPSAEAVWPVLDAAGIGRPTMAVRTGGGLHAYWLLSEALELVDDEARAQADRRAERFHGALDAAFEAAGWAAPDNVADLPRVLRVPGTLRTKEDAPDPLPVRLLWADGPRYELDALDAMSPPEEEFAAEPGGEARTEVRWTRRKRIVLDEPVGERTDECGPELTGRIRADYADRLAGLRTGTYVTGNYVNLRDLACWAGAREAILGDTIGDELYGAAEAGGTVARRGAKVVEDLIVTGLDIGRAAPYRPPAMRSAGKAEEATTHERPVEGPVGPGGPGTDDHRGDGPGGGHNGPTAEVFSRFNPGGPDGWPLTDLGNAERLVDAHGDDLRFVHPWGSWLVWDGARWSVDDTGAVERRAKDTVRAIYGRVAELEDRADRQALTKWAQKSESSGATRAMLTLATSEPGVPVRPELLDDRPWLLNVANGTLDLRTGELLRARREHYLTKRGPVAYDPDATCPRWLAFLDYTFAGDGELVEFVRRAIGYTLTGLTREQCLFLCHGPGRNGKSVFLRIVTALLGEDYAQQAPTSLLLNRDKNAATNDIARLRGARLVTAVETPEGRRLDENLAKQLTGGDKITARMLHKEFFEFTPVLKLWIATNHRPEIRGTDLAIWRRIRLVPFGVIVPEGDVDRDLGDKLEAELPGILAWAVAGCLAWQREGLRAPAAVVAATQAYRAEMDQIGRFIDERCQTGPASSVTAAVLFEAYRSWAADGGEHTVTARKFRDQLVERSFEYVKRGTDSASRLGNIWRGIGLLKLSEVVENRDS